jgi:hypothetical protein
MRANSGLLKVNSDTVLNLANVRTLNLLERRARHSPRGKDKGRASECE